MLVVMKHKASEEEISGVVDTIEAMGYGARPIPGAQRTAVGLIGNDGGVDSARLEVLEGVLEVIPVTHAYKQVSREWKEDDTLVSLPNGTVVGGSDLVLMAGPCAVEGEAQIVDIAHRLRGMGATILRGGAFKPRTSPYSFQGLAKEGLEYLARARAETGMMIVTEALDPDGADLVAEYADIIQIGARNMQNYPLLRRAGRRASPCSSSGACRRPSRSSSWPPSTSSPRATIRSSSASEASGASPSTRGTSWTSPPSPW